MLSVRMQWTRWCLLVLLAGGCAPGASSSDVASSSGTSAATPRGGAPGAQPTGLVAAVELGELPRTLGVGATSALSAVAYGSDGEPLDGAQVFFASTNGAGLAVSAAGVLTALRAGVYGVTAYSGAATSPPRWVSVYDPTPEPMRTTEVVVVLADGLGERELSVATLGDESAPLPPGAPTKLEVPEQRNWLLVVRDDALGQPLLMKFVRAAAPGLAHEAQGGPVVIDMESTA